MFLDQLPGLEAFWEAAYFDDMDAFIMIVVCMNCDGMFSLRSKD